jgi:hypothetical protein
MMARKKEPAAAKCKICNLRPEFFRSRPYGHDVLVWGAACHGTDPEHEFTLYGFRTRADSKRAWNSLMKSVDR